MSAQFNDHVFINLSPRDFRPGGSESFESLASPFEEGFPLPQSVNSFDGLQTIKAAEETCVSGLPYMMDLRSPLADYQSFFQSQISSPDHQRDKHMPERRRSSIINGLPQTPGWWLSHTAPDEDKFPRAPSSRTSLNTMSTFQWAKTGTPSANSGNPYESLFHEPREQASVIRQVIGSRMVYRNDQSEYLVHRSDYPDHKFSWVSKDIIRSVAMNKVNEFNCQRRLPCYKGPRGEMFTRKNAPHCSPADEETCVGCAQCGRGCS
ncbi:uncharacterized protein BKA55DRAFT_717204 [Fusarium redolens]|uniref:Uncharacterized protein n=1 Tax=Fusarium redolens TaxID=48865 RepID=A0A9P9JQI3_FUSRE|nr:uncharacterized protein BKA55DRAFT_717204 [Fusarium redolens]KAH7224427.1 hypothetical protein BKA55DRAFT_717204 [Fusarium redolens]